MFSKTRVTENRPQQNAAAAGDEPVKAPAPAQEQRASGGETAATPQPPRKQASPSVLSSDLIVTGNIRTDGDIQIEGKVEGDVRARQLTVGETATINGEIMGDEIIVNGRVVGRVRGLKVRLSAAARVEGDIIHKTIAIESGAHFEGSVQRQDDPLNPGAKSAPAQKPNPAS